jgi:hypothetical protein
MATEGNGQPISYKVDYSADLKNKIKSLHAQAASTGKGHQFLDALRAILKRLRENPKEFGEPVYHLPVLKLTVYQAILAPVVVDFGIHDEKPLVIIRGLSVLE